MVRHVLPCVMFLLEFIMSSTIFLKSEVRLLDKTGVPPCYKFKRVKVVCSSQ